MPSRALGLGALAALAALLLGVRRPLLEIRVEEGPRLVREALSPGETFTLSYLHSLVLEPVREVYALDGDGGVRVLEHAYRTQAAGLGQVPEEGRLVEEPGGWTRLVGLDRRVGSFALRVGQPRVDHRLEVRGREVRLSGLAPGERVWVGGRRVPLFCWILARRPAVGPRQLPWEASP